MEMDNMAIDQFVASITGLSEQEHKRCWVRLLQDNDPTLLSDDQIDLLMAKLKALAHTNLFGWRNSIPDKMNKFAKLAQRVDGRYAEVSDQVKNRFVVSKLKEALAKKIEKNSNRKPRTFKNSVVVRSDRNTRSAGLRHSSNDSIESQHAESNFDNSSNSEIWFESIFEQTQSEQTQPEQTEPEQTAPEPAHPDKLLQHYAGITSCLIQDATLLGKQSNGGFGGGHDILKCNEHDLDIFIPTLEQRGEVGCVVDAVSTDDFAPNPEPQYSHQCQQPQLGQRLLEESQSIEINAYRILGVDEDNARNDGRVLSRLFGLEPSAQQWPQWIARDTGAMRSSTEHTQLQRQQQPCSAASFESNYMGVGNLIDAVPLVSSDNAETISSDSDDNEYDGENALKFLTDQRVRRAPKQPRQSANSSGADGRGGGGDSINNDSFPPSQQRESEKMKRLLSQNELAAPRGGVEVMTDAAVKINEHASSHDSAAVVCEYPLPPASQPRIELDSCEDRKNDTNSSSGYEEDLQLALQKALDNQNPKHPNFDIIDCENNKGLSAEQEAIITTLVNEQRGDVTQEDARRLLLESQHGELNQCQYDQLQDRSKDSSDEELSPIICPNIPSPSSPSSPYYMSTTGISESTPAFPSQSMSVIVAGDNEQRRIADSVAILNSSTSFNNYTRGCHTIDGLERNVDGNASEPGKVVKEVAFGVVDSIASADLRKLHPQRAPNVIEDGEFDLQTRTSNYFHSSDDSNEVLSAEQEAIIKTLVNEQKGDVTQEDARRLLLESQHGELNQYDIDYQMQQQLHHRDEEELESQVIVPVWPTPTMLQQLPSESITTPSAQIPTSLTTNSAIRTTPTPTLAQPSVELEQLRIGDQVRLATRDLIDGVLTDKDVGVIVEIITAARSPYIVEAKTGRMKGKSAPYRANEITKECTPLEVKKGFQSLFKPSQRSTNNSSIKDGFRSLERYHRIQLLCETFISIGELIESKSKPSTSARTPSEDAEPPPTAPQTTAATTPASATPAVRDPNIETVNWVQCDSCGKWRKLPNHVSLSKLPKKWQCKLNKWDPAHNNCEAEEEE